MQLSEDAVLALRWMEVGATMEWRSDGDLDIGAYIIHWTTKDELLRCGLIRPGERRLYHLTPAGRKAQESFKLHSARDAYDEHIERAVKEALGEERDEK